jgi:hypothetical protein
MALYIDPSSLSQPKHVSRILGAELVGGEDCEDETLQ